MERRRLLLSLAALVAVPSPAIVRASSLMPISPVANIIFPRRICIRFQLTEDGIIENPEWVQIDQIVSSVFAA